MIIKVLISSGKLKSAEIMNKQLLLICQGRSGSTTLMRLLNSIDGVNISGENMDMIGSLMEFYQRAKLTVKQSGYTKNYEEDVYPSWYNTFDLEDVREELRRMIVRLYRGNEFRVWGFKKIRTGLSGREHFYTTLDNFRELFGSAKFLFLYREDTEAQSRSAWWADDPESSKKLLIEQLELFRKYNSGNPGFTYMMSMEDIISMNSAFLNMYEFIEEKADIQKIKQIIGSKLDY